MKKLIFFLATLVPAATFADEKPVPSVVRTSPAQTDESRAGADGSLHLAEARVSDILVTYGKLTGKKIIADVTVQGQINLVIDQPLSVESGAALIEKALFLNGFSLIDAGDDTVLVAGLGMLVRSHGVPVYTDPAEFPKAERVFSYVYKVQHGDGRELAGFLQQYIPPSNEVSFTAGPNGSVLLITAPTRIVLAVIRVLAAVDVAPSPNEAKSAAVESSDAAVMAERVARAEQKALGDQRPAADAAPTPQPIPVNRPATPFILR